MQKSGLTFSLLVFAVFALLSSFLLIKKDEQRAIQMEKTGNKEKSATRKALCYSADRWTEGWEQKFESYQPSDIIMDVIGVKPGMTIGEVGAGNGRFAIKVASRVGVDGRVYANDIDPEAIRVMTERCLHEKINNMSVVHGKPTEPGFPEGKLDMVYMINTYFELIDPVALMKNIAPVLKPNSRLAIIKRKPATSQELVIIQAEKAGYELVHVDTSLIYDNIYIFRFKE